MSNAKIRSFKLWESIEQQHLEFFERSRKEIEARIEDDRKTKDKRYEDIFKRFEESRIAFEAALAEMRHTNMRIIGVDLSWKEVRKLMEDRVNADRRATDMRLQADRIASEARLDKELHAAEERHEKARLAVELKLENERLIAEARLEKERLTSEARLEKERLASEARILADRKEFASQKRWLIINFVGIIGVLAGLIGIIVAIAIFLMQTLPPPPLVAS